MKVDNIKPWDLLIVRASSDCNVIAEAVSYPTDIDTVCVRMLPNDPGTMREIAMTDVVERASKSACKWIHYARVRGRGTFPADMLRYDSAVIVPRYDGPNEPDTSVIIGRVTSRRMRTWTYARWNSFGWMLEHLKAVKFEGGGR